MKKIITTLALAAFIASPAFAATKTKKKTTVKTTTTTTTSSPAVEETTRSEPVTSSSSSTSFPTHRSTQSPILSADFGLGTINSTFVFGVGFKAQWPVELDHNDFKFGAQTGFYLAPSTPTSFLIPILATAQYDFRASGSTMVPYLGLGMGISILKASGYSSSTDFALLFMPGVNFEEGKYFFELPLGVLATSFAILPSIGARF